MHVHEKSIPLYTLWHKQLCVIFATIFEKAAKQYFRFFFVQRERKLLLTQLESNRAMRALFR